MFLLPKSRKNVKAAEDISRSLQGLVKPLEEVERAIAFLLAISIIRFVEFDSGSDLNRCSGTIHLSKIDASISNMLEIRSICFDLIEKSDDLGDPPSREHLISLASYSICIATLSVFRTMNVWPQVHLAWRELYRCKGKVRDAIRWIRDYEAHYGVEFMPRVDRQPFLSDIDIMKLPSLLPSFIRNTEPPKIR